MSLEKVEAYECLSYAEHQKVPAVGFEENILEILLLARLINKDLMICPRKGYSIFRNQAKLLQPIGKSE